MIYSSSFHLRTKRILAKSPIGKQEIARQFVKVEIAKLVTDQLHFEVVETFDFQGRAMEEYTTKFLSMPLNKWEDIKSRLLELKIHSSTSIVLAAKIDEIIHDIEKT